MVQISLLTAICTLASIISANLKDSDSTSGKIAQTILVSF